MLSADLTSLPSRLQESSRDFINSREIYRQPSSWGCWEPGRPPESFPFSCPSSSLSSLLPLLRCQQAPGPDAERKSGSRRVPRSGSRKIRWGGGQGEGPGKPLLLHTGPGSGEGKLLVPLGLADCSGPRGAVHLSRLAGTCHRRLPRRPTRAVRGGGGGGSGGCSGRDLGWLTSLTGLGAAVDGF